MLKLLTQPFPSSTQIYNRIRTALIYGLFVFLFLFIFQPFDLSHLATETLFPTTALYGLVCFGTLLICFLLLPALLPSFYDEKHWTVWKEILHTLFCVSMVAIANIVFSHWWLHIPLGPGLIGEFLFNTFSVSILPIIFWVLVRQMRLMRTYTRKAEDLNRQLTGAETFPPVRTPPIRTPSVSTPSVSTPTVDIPTVNIPTVNIPATTPAAVTIPTPQPSVFLYAESADNYVRVFTLEDGKLSRQIVRNTLKNFESSFPSDDAVFRCHRAYIVNLKKVSHISGNAQGYKLHLEGVDEPVPVSRNLNKEIAARIGRTTRSAPGA